MASASIFRKLLRRHNVIDTNKSIGEMISQGRKAFPRNVMQTNQGPVKALSSKTHVQTARESHDLNMGFCDFKQLRVTNSHARTLFRLSIFTWLPREEMRLSPDLAHFIHRGNEYDKASNDGF